MLTDRWLRRALIAVAAAGTSLALLASCGGSSGGSSGGSDGGGEPAPSSSASLTEDVLVSVLLTGADIGGDFETRPASGRGMTLPCAPAGQGTLDQQAPPALQARTLLLSTALQGQMTEQLKVYDNAAAASAALAIFIDGFACATGTLYADDGSTAPVSIVGPSDVTADVAVTQVDGVVGWEFTAADVGGLAIVAQFGASLMFLTFLSPIASDPASYPDPLQVIRAALTKIVSS